MKRLSTNTLFGFLIFVAIGSVFLSVNIGSVSLRVWDLLRSHQGLSIESQYAIFQLRLFRTFCAFITGGLLALAGALMQILFRNPLADPYITGTSGGAACATLIALLIGFPIWPLNIFAFIGAFFSILIVISLERPRSFTSVHHLLLTGIVISMGWGALIAFIFTLASHENLPNMVFWLIGDLSQSQFSIYQFFALVFGLIVSLSFAESLNVLSRGTIVARTLGINVQRLHLMLYLLSSFLTAWAVSIAGCISFIGLIIPHMLRLVGSSNHWFILPSSVLLGGSLLTFSDALARSVMAPIQLPVGIVTAIIGVPLFLILLRCPEK